MRIQFKVWRSAAAGVRGGKPKQPRRAHTDTRIITFSRRLIHKYYSTKTKKKYKNSCGRVHSAEK